MNTNSNRQSANDNQRLDRALAAGRAPGAGLQGPANHGQNGHGQVSAVVPNPTRLGSARKQLEAERKDERTQQYKMPADVMERYLAAEANKDDDSEPQSERSLHTPMNMCEEGPPSPEPLPRFSSPRVPFDLLPITPVLDHELAEEVTTLHLAPDDMAEAPASEREYSGTTRLERDSEMDRQTSARIIAEPPVLHRAPAAQRHLRDDVTSPGAAFHEERQSATTSRQVQLVLLGSLMVSFGAVLGWLLSRW